MGLTKEQEQQYKQDGFVLIRKAIPSAVIDLLEKRFLSLVDEWGQHHFETTQSEKLAEFLRNNKELERKLYDGIRRFPWLTEFGAVSEIVEPVTDLLGEPAGLMGKIPFRIDLPWVTRELAVWHQDYRYVRGNTGIITAWVPLQDTGYINGCLMVMPGSHKMGILEHDMETLGKRHFPSYVFDREVRYVEMMRGDILLFHSLLLHSSSLNMSSTPRFSIQARYSAISAPTDSIMGEIISV